METSSYDEQYLEALKREVYYDVASGYLKLGDITSIMAGAEEYLHLRAQFLTRLKAWRNWITSILTHHIKYLFKRGTIMINGKAINAERIIKEFSRLDYVCDDSIAHSVYLSLLLQKPLLIEGDPGVGKTEIAKALAAMLDTELIRLQCYEGLDESKALYEWNYQKQLLFIQGQEHGFSDVFTEEFLMQRPLMKAILCEDRAPVLLIDEIDKADEEFEAFLLEILSDFQISIPEFGTIRARTVPHIIITNNDVRELTNALKRRCIYLYIDYPTIEKEQNILIKKVPGIKAPVAQQIARLMNILRSKADLLKKPSIAEGIDFGRAATLENIEVVDGEVIDRFVATLLKNKEDVAMLRKRGGGKWLGNI
ncbi:MAG: MoxR family ATPase [Syntrophomonas sp.]